MAWRATIPLISPVMTPALKFGFRVLKKSRRYAEFVGPYLCQTPSSRAPNIDAPRSRREAVGAPLRRMSKTTSVTGTAPSPGSRRSTFIRPRSPGPRSGRHGRIGGRYAPSSSRTMRLTRPPSSSIPDFMMWPITLPIIFGSSTPSSAMAPSTILRVSSSPGSCGIQRAR